MDVFGVTIMGERNKHILNLNEKINDKCAKVNQISNKHSISIDILEEKSNYYQTRLRVAWMTSNQM